MARVAVTEVYQALKNRIIRYELKPNQRLTEAGLADEFAISRTPVREALRLLAQEGWIVMTPHAGYSVRDFSLKELDDLYEVRIALERLAVSLAARHMPPDLFHRLYAFWSRPEQHDNEDHLEMLRRDEGFHESLASASGNAELLRQLRSINERIRIIRRIDFTRNPRVAATFRQHAQVLEFLRDGRVDRAEGAIEDHIRQSKAMVVQLAQEGLARIYLKANEQDGS